MADPADVAASKLVRKEFGKSGVDITHVDLRVSHGICYIRGTAAANKGVEVSGDLRSEMERVVKIIRQRPGIKDVVLDVRYRL